MFTFTPEMGSLSDENIKALKPYFEIKDTVIVAPLNWGLGHAARCIPIIHWLKSITNEVIIASDGVALELLKEEFPDLRHYPLPSYKIEYRYDSILLNILLDIPNILFATYKERKQTNEIIKNTGATIILSDNRLGFRNALTKNYYMTHQLNLLHSNSLISKIGSKIHQWYISRFDTCFIPDFKAELSICPALSKSNLPNTVYLGTLSRIDKMVTTIENDIVVILSGPEPQRSMLESVLWTALIKLPMYKTLFIRGTKTKRKHTDEYNHIEVKDFVSQNEISKTLNQSKLLITRSGYTTMMDIHNLEIKAILIPTPGQTEQEYLADYHQKNTRFQKLSQNELNKLQKTIKSLI